MFRREWRRQALVLVLLMVAVAATIVGLGAVSNLSQLKADPTFGTANTILILPGSDPQLAADIAAIRSRFGAIDVIAHQNIPIPGSVSSVDLRAESPGGPYGDVTLRLDSGRYPTRAGQIAVTEDVAKTFGLHLGGIWTEGGQSRQVVGIVENPLDLLDQFALVAPGQANPPAQVSILVNSNEQALQSLNLPSGTGLNASSRGTASKTAAEAIVLVLGSLGLLFVGLMAVAGFTVIAQRRLRALGMLGALGATDRHIRLVMVANGAAVGATAAITGFTIGLAGWFAFAPTLQSISEQRVDPLALPWWAIGAALLLTFVTAVAAAWWPARQVARISTVAALSGRPPRPQPAHRFAALGSILLGAGLVMLAFADQRRGRFHYRGYGHYHGGAAVPGAARDQGARRHRQALARVGQAGRTGSEPLPGPFRRGAGGGHLCHRYRSHHRDQRGSSAGPDRSWKSSDRPTDALSVTRRPGKPDPTNQRLAATEPERGRQPDRSRRRGEVGRALG